MNYKKERINQQNFDESYNLFADRLYFCEISGTILLTFVRHGKTRKAESGEFT